MKTRNLTRLGALALTLVMVTTSLIGGTLAKYTTTLSATDSVTIARFGYEANDGSDELTYIKNTRQSIDLFDDLTTDATGTIGMDSDGYSLFAPGAYGSFQIELNGTNSDVDLEMTGSEVIAEVTDGTGTASTSDDYFISYTIIYNPLEVEKDTDDFSGTYAVQRVSMNQLATDLEEVLSSIVLAKNSIGTITVYYAWENFDDGSTSLFKNHTNEISDDLTYDEADTYLVQTWTDANVYGVYADDSNVVAPTFTLTISNTASQVVTDGGVSYTKNSWVTVSEDVSGNFLGYNYANGKYTNYTVIETTSSD